jgi:ABC-2 type transport system ATP-binding protein
VEYAIEARGLRKAYPGFALEGLSFSLARGEVMGFIGPNGSGKTTTIRILMGLVRREGGELRILGEDPAKAGPSIRQRIGFVYDEGKFYGNLSSLDTGRLVAPHYRGWDWEKYRGYLKSFGVPPGKKLDELSKGMRTKAALAVALSHGAELVLMDEPTSGLDPVFRAELLDILYDIIQDERKAIFFSTHITADLERIADKITFIDRGSLVFSELKDEVLERYSLVKGPMAALDEGLRSELVSVRETQTGFEGLSTGPLAGDGAARPDILREKASLDDIMVGYARRAS